MELAIPVLALGGLYIISNQSKNPSSSTLGNNQENFATSQYDNPYLPNTNIPDKNYPGEFPHNPVNNAQTDLTTKLSTVNVFDSPQVYTDRFFNPAVNGSNVNTGAMQNSSINAQGAPAGVASNSYYSMAGNKVDSSYFTHNNMVPFFGSHSRTNRTDANVTEGLMDNYTGAGSQIFTKKEVAPLFTPNENYQWAHGMPNNSDFIRSRINPSMSMANVKPFAEQQVGPGLAAGYGTEGVGGYNSALIARDYYREKTVDELRVDNKPKPGGVGLYGHEGPAVSYIPTIGTADMIGRVEKNRVQKDFAMGQDRLFTTKGAATAPASRAILIEKQQTRPETHTEYTGIGSNTSFGQLVDGEYMPSKHIDLGELPLGTPFAHGANGATEGDYGIKSQMAYPNNRTQNPEPGYFGAVGGAMGAVIAPLLDMLRPSRRENTVGTLRPYQNPGSSVSQGHIFNPADRPAPTIRETTENSTGHLYINANQLGGAYRVTPQNPKDTMRQETSDFYYAGGASASDRTKQMRNYEAEYAQTSNNLKSSAITGYTPSGGIGLLNSSVNQTAKTTRETELKNQRQIYGDMPYQTPSIGTMGTQITNPMELYQGSQLDRNNGDILSQLKGNPFAISHLGAL